MEELVVHSLTMSWILHNLISISNAYGGGKNPENIALNKPAWQSHPYNPGPGAFSYIWSGVLAKNAVNGLKTDLTYPSGHCVISQDRLRTATLRVDLESILRINHIKIYYRTDNAKWGPSNGYTARFLGFYLYVSNTTNRNDGYLCYHDTTYTRATIPPVVNIACPVYGQYVIYYNERLEGVKYPKDYSTFAFNEVCELEVYGCNEEYSGGKCPEYCEDCLHYKQCPEGDKTCQKVCPLGFYGPKCEKRCSSNCHYTNRCNSVYGVCQGGCKASWKGPLCDKECGSGEYGRNCSIRCGHCQNEDKCNPIDGSCPAGCAEGYTGETCSNNEGDAIRHFDRPDFSAHSHGSTYDRSAGYGIRKTRFPTVLLSKSSVSFPLF